MQHIEHGHLSYIGVGHNTRTHYENDGTKVTHEALVPTLRCIAIAKLGGESRGPKLLICSRDHGM